MRNHRNGNVISSDLLTSLMNRANNNFNNYIKKKYTKDVTPESVIISENKLLLESLYDAKVEWTTALENFQSADSQDMVDYYSYKITASQIKYNYLLKQAKEKGLNLKLITETSTA